MARENMTNDPIMIQSSIALLQERFRQLQRVKEMREERELHRMQCSYYYCYEPSSRFFFHFLPPTPQVWSNNSQSKLLLLHHDDHFQCMETPLLTPAMSTTTSSTHASAKNLETCNFDDVDTSLHL